MKEFLVPCIQKYPVLEKILKEFLRPCIQKYPALEKILKEFLRPCIQKYHDENTQTGEAPVETKFDYHLSPMKSFQSPVIFHSEVEECNNSSTFADHMEDDEVTGLKSSSSCFRSTQVQQRLAGPHSMLDQFNFVHHNSVVTQAGDALWVSTWKWYEEDYTHSSTPSSEGEDKEEITTHIAMRAPLFHFRIMDFVENHGLISFLIIPAMMKESLGTNVHIVKCSLR